MRHRRGETDDGTARLAAALSAYSSAAARGASGFYTATTTGTSTSTSYVDLPVPPSVFALQVKGTGGAPSTWDVYLQYSLDGTNWTNMIRHVQGTDADGATVTVGTSRYPALYTRFNVVALTLGGSATSIVCTSLATL